MSTRKLLLYLLLCAGVPVAVAVVWWYYWPSYRLGQAERLTIRGGRFDAKVAVENISAGYHTLAEAFSGWRDSPPHRANMLNKGVTRMGIAAIYSPKSKYKVFWTLILAAPDDKRG